MVGKDLSDDLAEDLLSPLVFFVAGQHAESGVVAVKQRRDGGKRRVLLELLDELVVVVVVVIVVSVVSMIIVSMVRVGEPWRRLERIVVRRLTVSVAPEGSLATHEEGE